MKAKLFPTVIATLAFALCAQGGTVRTAGGVTLCFNNAKDGARLVRLTVMRDNIVRVEATPDSSFCDKRSLIIVPGAQAARPHFSTSETAQSLTLTTARLRVTVSKRTGRLLFTDRATGRTLLRETATGGKRFSRYVSAQTEMPPGYHPSAPGEIARLTDSVRTGYTWRARFETQDGEALYGLGQHQSEEMNCRGRNEELFQYNTKVSVPFVMSTKGYGLLWDSYSYGRWGSPDDYLQLNRAFRLYDKYGRRGALTGTYTDSKGRWLERREDSVYYEHSGVVGNLPQQVRLSGASVVYEGSVEAPETASYHFILYYAGYVKVSVDGHTVVPKRWRTAWNPNAYKFSVALEKGRRTPLRIEWKPDGSVSYCGLRVARQLPADERDNISIWAEMDRYMDYYLIAGSSMDEIVSGYRTLTGRAQVMPKWALGFWQSRERYKTQQEVVGTLAEFRKRGIPVDNIVQDWNYWPQDAWGSHRFDSARFPSPQAMMDSIHAMHGRLMISVWPKFYCSTANYRQLDANGWIYRQAVRDSLRDWVGPGYLGSFYDAYAAGARRLFWHQMDSCLYSKYKQGIDAWWMDASEPNVRDCTPLAYRKALCGPTALGASDEYFNAYSLANAEAIYNGQRSVAPNRRVFQLTRSGFAGLQRYSTATWSGDIGARWEDMRAQMTAGINFSMSGIPFWGMDQGGFCVESRYVKAQQLYDRTGQENEDLEEWRELQARWNQFGCFIPLYRAHGQWPLREVWNIAPEGHPAYETIVWHDRLRYRLMPYLYSMAGWVHFRDYTMMRGLAMDFAGDERVLGIGDQWMFGPSLMACPVGAYKARTRRVYLPAQCGWHNLHTGEHLDGGQTVTADAPYGRIPVFVPDGAIIPLGPEMQWSDEKEPDSIDLCVYSGRNGSFELYEDEGTNYNYERGRFATITFNYDDRRRTLTIGKRKGSFSGMLATRVFNVTLNPALTADGRCESTAGKTVRAVYRGRQITIKL